MRATLMMAAALMASVSCADGGAAERANIPNIAGKILTVNGPIEPAELGHTLMHEHLFIDFTLPDDEPQRWILADRVKPAGATDVEFYNRPLTLDILGAVQLGRMNRDNYLLDDEKQAIAEVAEFKKHGGRTIVDVTNIGLKRNPEGLRRIANATGVNIVMGASWYTKAWHPKDMDTRTVESLTDEVVRDVTVGVGDTGIRSGVIGEVGTSGNPLTPNEIKIIRSAARASRLTGAAISLHTWAQAREHQNILDMLAKEGADLSRVIVGHADPLANDVPYLMELLRRGVYVQFDVLGRPPLITRRRPTDLQVADATIALIKAGYGERLLLSQDICTKTSLKAYGGTGYSFVDEIFLPHLKRQGVAPEQIEALVVENPKRVLTFVAPQPLLAQSKKQRS